MSGALANLIIDMAFGPEIYSLAFLFVCFLKIGLDARGGELLDLS